MNTFSQAIRVLIAEDDYLVRTLLKGILFQLGYTIAGEAADGEKAVELTCSLRPDVVLMDIAMPKLDGVEATQKIQASCPTPVVVLTAYEASDLLERASAAGASAYLLKPPNAGQIERAIITALARFADMMTLRQYALELKQRNEELDAFAHTVAHDLKNPLGLIITGMGYLRDEDLPKDQASELIQMICHSADKMKEIVESLLLLARVRQQEVTTKPLDMGTIVSEVLAQSNRKIEELQADIILPQTWPVALGYAPWIEQVWTNYLSNALKYGGQPPQVELGAIVLEDDRPTVRFWVRDNGNGLAPEDQARLFVPFSRLHSSIQGHGLGLTIAQRIVQKLGGHVGVESQVGHGSTFFFTLPQS